ncbi:hypothetical protein FKW77_001487 [Venturia effusa]|uniref:Kelch repeat-containing protein n=1 Tax=Venturia effusa TaxID=50376 RepID=A0A517LI50_9PEZI|nr:hypothetical protein FKW77_001487 [Venturia effusa]
MASFGHFVFSLLLGLSAAQKDPLKDFCRRFSHQTAVVDRRIYIDGGLVNFSPFDADPLNYTNKDILYADFDVDNDGMPQVYNTLSKPASVPSVIGGILWEDKINKVMLYLYGGEYSQDSPDDFENWAYDIVNNNWTIISPDGTQSSVRRASFGAGVAVQDIAKGYYYGGWMTNQTIPSFGPNPVALSSLISYDMVKNTWRNISGPDSVGRAEGAMSYIPASDGGMLVYFGGIQTLYNNGSWQGVPMSEIHLYDIANNKWYTQVATGDVPNMRRRFCAGATWAQDQSSYNIYLYGGASMPPLTVGFDDVYILSIPSFTWIKWYPTEPGTAYPHHSLTCNIIDNTQMIVMGGTFPNATNCDVPAIFGLHNLDLGKNNAEGAKWAKFKGNKSSKYKVPSEISDVIGGGATGGATMKAPELGFADRDLSTYFGRIYAPQSRAPTRTLPTATSVPPSSNKNPNIGAIAGGAAGGGVLLLSIVALLVRLCMKQRKRSAAAVAGQQDPNQQSGRYASHTQQAYRMPLQGGELPTDTVHEMPGRTFSPMTTVTSKPGLAFQIHPHTSTTPPSTNSPYSQPHSPARSPPLPFQSPTHSPQGQFPAPSPPYAVIPPYRPQTPNQQFGPPLHSTQSERCSPPLPAFAQPVPQHHYIPQSQVYYPPPPQDYESSAPAPPSNAGIATDVRRREDGAGSSNPGFGPGYQHARYR